MGGEQNRFLLGETAGEEGRLRHHGRTTREAAAPMTTAGTGGTGGTGGHRRRPTITRRASLRFVPSDIQIKAVDDI